MAVLIGNHNMNVRGGAESLKGSHRMGERRILQKISAPGPLIKTFCNDDTFSQVNADGQLF
jgi:hypothetical protein